MDRALRGMVVHHPPSRWMPARRRDTNPNRCEPTSSIGYSASSENVLSGHDRLIRTDRPNFEMIIAESLDGASGPPVSGAHLAVDSAHPAHESRRSHRRRRIRVRREINGKLTAIPAGGSCVEGRFDRSGVRAGRELKSVSSRAHLTGARRKDHGRSRRREHSIASHHFSGTSLRLVPQGSVRIHSPFSSFTGYPAALTLCAAAAASFFVGTMISHSSSRASASVAGGAPRAQTLVPRWW